MMALFTHGGGTADLPVKVDGAEADRWLDIAQAYRGSPGLRRVPGSSVVHDHEPKWSLQHWFDP